MTRTATMKKRNRAAKATRTMAPIMNVPTMPNNQPAKPKTSRKMGNSNNNSNSKKITMIAPFCPGNPG